MGLVKLIGVSISSAFKKGRAFHCYGRCKYYSYSKPGGCSALSKDKRKTELAIPGRICVNPEQGREAWEERQKWLNTPRSRPYYPPSYDPYMGET